MRTPRDEARGLANIVAAVRRHDARRLRQLAGSEVGGLFRRAVRGQVALATSLYSVGLLEEAAAEFRDLSRRVGQRRLRRVPGAWLATLPQLPRLTTSLRDRLPIPFWVRGGVPVIAASVNGRPGRFMIDTGSSTCMLSSAFCDENRIPYAGEPAFLDVDAAGREVTIWPCLVETFQIGGVIVRDALVQVVDLPRTLAIAGTLQPLELLRRVCTELDGPARVLRVHEAAFRPERALRGQGVAAHLTPLVWAGTNVFVYATIERGRAARAGFFLLDTGATAHWIAADVANALGFPHGRAHRIGLSAAGRTVGRSGGRARLRVSDAPPAVETFEVRTPRSAAHPWEIAPFGRAGTIGAPWALRRRVFFPAGGRRLVFT